MRRPVLLRIFFNFFVICVICSKFGFADIDNNKGLQKVIHEMEQEAQGLVGGAIAIVSEDKVIYKKPFGHAQVNGSLVNEDTLFSLASVSKPLVATALAVLKDKGIVGFDDKVIIHGQKIPLKNILSHTSGFKVRGDTQIESGYSRKDLSEMLNKEPQDLAQAGDPYFYSNLVFSLTQDYAQAKGYRLDQLVKELNIGAQAWPVKAKNLAYPHSRQREKFFLPSKYQVAVPASAGIFSSLNGMIEFLQIAMGNRPNVVSKKTLDELFEPLARANDIYNWKLLPFKDEEVDSWYGLGWRRLSVKGTKNSTLICHSGFFNGASVFVGIMPENKIGIVIMSNQVTKFHLRNGFKLWRAIVTSD